MSISITLPDDADDWQLSAAADFFAMLAKGERLAAHHAGSLPEVPCKPAQASEEAKRRNVISYARVGDTPPVIAPEDNPEAGVEPTVTAPQPEDTAPTAEDAAAAFVTPVPPPLPIVTAAGAALGLPVHGEAQSGDTPQVDKTGLPWDQRIHSDGKNKLNADGTWRKRRGVSEIDYKRIEAELRGTPPAPQVPPPPATAPTLTVVPPAPFVPPAAPSVPPPPTVSASPAVPPAGSAPTTFAQIAGMIGPLMAPKGSLTQEMIGRAMQAHGLGPGLPLLAASQDKIPAVWASIQNLLNGGQP